MSDQTPEILFVMGGDASSGLLESAAAHYGQFKIGSIGLDADDHDIASEQEHQPPPMIIVIFDDDLDRFAAACSKWSSAFPDVPVIAVTHNDMGPYLEIDWRRIMRFNQDQQTEPFAALIALLAQVIAKR